MMLLFCLGGDIFITAYIQTDISTTNDTNHQLMMLLFCLGHDILVCRATKTIHKITKDIDLLGMC